MSTPEIAFRRFLTGLVLGCVLGMFYGFLRPVRGRKAALPDLIFAVFAGWVYLYYGFAVCRGDLRMGYLAAPVAGAIGWDRTVGRWLQPVFGAFWQMIAKTVCPLGKILKKIWIFLKFLFASGTKWVTIKWRNRKHPKKGVPNEESSV